MPVVEVAVPDGCFTGDVFTVTSGEQQLDVTVPDGCGPGELLAVELPDEPSAAAAEDTLEVQVPDGCDVGSSFLVALPDGREIEITVPDGCGPGMMLAVAVPPAEDAPAPPAEPPAPPPRTYDSSSLRGDSSSSSSSYSRGGLFGSSYTSGSSYGGGTSTLGTGLGTPSGLLPGSSAPTPAPAPAKSAEWAPASSLFAMGPSEGFGREVGDFHVGQLVQVTRSDGSWTYGKIMDYDDLGGTYSVMTRAGPKHFVERDTITDDIVVNPSDGSCAQQ